MKTNEYTRDNAVSPVVGVLLMLVVTIIIAAVVSGFAGGFSSGATKAPQASIQIQTGYGTNTQGTATNYNGFDISFIHKGGDAITTKDIKIITWLTLPNGTVIQHSTTANSPPVWETGNFTVAGPAKYLKAPFSYDLVKYNSGNYKSRDDIINPAFETPANWFGQYTFTDGMSVRTYSKNATAAFLGLVPESSIFPGVQADYDTGSKLLQECIQQQSPLEIKWLHIPSGKYVLDQKINLQG